MRPDDQPIPISALQHWLYCPRQCALIHNEQVWAENRFTAEGQLLHKKANEGPDEHRAAGSVLRHMNVSSEIYGITGICDIVERSRDGRYTPVEYKRGKPKAHPTGEGSQRKFINPDEVQVCAQALCLEEMFNTSIPTALIFYGKTRRRTEVPLDDDLRALTLATIAAVHDMKRTSITPTAEYDARRCDACSLIDLCQPRSLRLKRGAAYWFQSHLKSEIVNLKSQEP